MMRKLMFALVGLTALAATGAMAPANAQICVGPGCFDGPRYNEWRPYRHHFYHHDYYGYGWNRPYWDRY